MAGSAAAILTEHTPPLTPATSALPAAGASDVDIADKPVVPLLEKATETPSTQTDNSLQVTPAFLPSFSETVPLTPETPALRKYSEDDEVAQRKDEAERVQRLGILDNEIATREARVSDLHILAADLALRLRNEQTAFDAHVANHRRVMKTQEQDVMRREVIVNEAKEVAEAAQRKLEQARKKWEGTRDERQATLKRLATNVEEKEEALTLATAALEETRQKRKQIDKEYLDVSQGYRHTLAQAMRRRDTVVREVAEATEELGEIRREVKHSKRGLARQREALETREASLVDREKVVDTRERAVADKYATLQSAIAEWRERGAHLPDDTITS